MTSPGIGRVVATVLAALFCTSDSAAVAESSRTFDEATLRGFTTLERVLDTAGTLAGGGGEYGSRGKGQLCILVDPERELLPHLGSVEAASRRLFARLAGRTNVHVRVYGNTRTRLAKDESELCALLESRIGSVSLPIDVFAEIRRTVALMDRTANPRTLLVICRRGASAATKIGETIAAAKAAAVRVVVAAPEAVFTVPPQDTLNAGVLYTRAAPPRGGAIFCESQFPEHAVFSLENLTGVFVYEPEWETRDFELSDLGEVPLPLPPDLPLPDDAAPTVRIGPIKVVLSLFRHWPDHPGVWQDPGEAGNPRPVAEESLGLGLDDSGFPPIPAGYGYWPLTRLAAETGGKYLLTTFSKSKCPFRATYDPRRLRAVQPSLGSGDGAGPTSDEREALFRLWREMTRCGLALHRAEFGDEGGLAADAARNQRIRFKNSYQGPSECRAEALGREQMADEIRGIRSRVRELQRAGDGAERLMTDRMRATLDLLQCNLARARFHLLERAECLRRGAPDVFAEGRGALLLYRKRLLRFWEGLDAARALLPGVLADLPEKLHEPFREAFDSTSSVMEKWEGTPYGATARSSALWRMQLIVPTSGGDRSGRFEDPTGVPPGGVPGTPSSDGGGTDTPR